MKMGDTSLPSSPLPGRGVAHLLGRVSLTPSLGSSRVYKTLGANPWLILPLWGLPRWQYGGSVGDGLILPPPRRSLPLALTRSYCCGPHYPRQQGAGTTVEGFITLSLCWSCHHWGRHVRVTPAVVVSPHRRWATHVVVELAT